MARNRWSGVTPGRRSSGRRSSSSRNSLESHFKSYFSNYAAPEDLVSSPRLNKAVRDILAGDDNKAARRAYQRLMASDAPDSVKHRADQIIKGRDKPHNKGLFSKVTGGIGGALEKALMVIDKPKRAVQATIDEGLEQLYGEEDDQSWADHVLRAKSYGGGELVEHANEMQKRHGGGGPLSLAGSKWGKRLQGLVLDVGMDPLTYATGGVKPVIEKAAEGAAAREGAEAVGRAAAPRLGRHVGRAEPELEREIVDALEQGVKTSRRTRNAVKGREVGRIEAVQRLADAGLTDAAARFGQGGKFRVTAKELEEAGLKGGIHGPKILGSPTIVPHEIERLLGGRLVGRLHEIGSVNPVARGFVERFGQDELAGLRQMAHSKGSSEQIVQGILGVAAGKSGRLAGDALGHAAEIEAARIAKNLDQAGVDSADLVDAVRGNADVLGKLSPEGKAVVQQVKDFYKKFRLDVNELTGREFLKDAGDNYYARLLPKERLEELDKQFKAGSRHTKRRLKSDVIDPELSDELLGVKLGSEEALKYGPTDEDQIEGILREAFGDEAISFSKDVSTDLPRYIHSVLKAAQPEVFRGQLRKRGILDVDNAGIQRAITSLRDVAGDRGADASELGARLRSAGLLDPYDAVDVGVAERPSGGVLDDLGAIPDDAAQNVENALSNKDLRTAARIVGAPDAAKANLGKLQKSLQKMGLLDEDGLPVQAAIDVHDDAMAGFDAATGATRAPELRLGTLERKSLDPKYVDAPEAASNLESATRYAQIAKERLDAGDTTSAANWGLVSQYHEAVADAVASGQRAVEMEAAMKVLGGNPAAAEMFKGSIADARRELADAGFAEEPVWMMEAFARTKDWDVPEFVKYFDGVNRMFKTYAILSPGFHVRNSMGAYFNNFVGGVDFSDYHAIRRGFRQYRKAVDAGASHELATEAIQDPIVRRIVAGGLPQDGNRIGAEAAEYARAGKILGTGGVPRPGSHKPSILTDNPLTRSSRFLGERIEEVHRGAMAYSTLAKGGTWDEAVERVYKFHFDYNDLSTLEKEGMRRLIPFWTWTSRNMGLTFENILRRPKGYRFFQHFKTAVDDREGEDPLVPDYMANTATTMRLPLGVREKLDDILPGHGAPEYLTPDLPFLSADDTLRTFSRNPVQGIAQDMTPTIKIPLEASSGKQFFEGLPLSDERQDVPASWQRIPGLVQGLKLLPGFVEEDRFGNDQISGKNAYYIESYLPLLGRARRLAPSEKKYQDRALQSWLSFVGLQTGQPTEAVKSSVRQSRLADLKKMLDSAENSGYDVGRKHRAKK